MFSLQFRGRPLTPARILQAVQLRIRDRLQPINEVRGVYASFAEAAAAAPRTKPVGYDFAHAENWYEDKLSAPRLADYPVIFWLGRAFADASSVFEIGGHVGTAYYGFSTILRYPAEHQWTILDVPTVVTAGRTLAAARGAQNLHFTADPSLVDGAEIVLASGSLQYLEGRIAQILNGWRVHPRHVLINVTPVYDGPEFVTLQNIGSAYCAYHVFNRQAFIQELASAGYALVDSWAIPRHFHVPGHRERSFNEYSGFYFRRQ